MLRALVVPVRVTDQYVTCFGHGGGSAGGPCGHLGSAVYVHLLWVECLEHDVTHGVDLGHSGRSIRGSTAPSQQPVATVKRLQATLDADVDIRIWSILPHHAAGLRCFIQGILYTARVLRRVLCAVIEEGDVAVG